jgi:hypothetical protein
VEVLTALRNQGCAVDKIEVLKFLYDGAARIPFGRECVCCVCERVFVCMSV